MKVSESSFLRDLDKTLAIAGIALSLILTIYFVREIGRAVYVLTGILALISCLLWLTIRKSHTFEFHFSESRTQTLLCSIFFFGLFTLSILAVYFRSELYERPLLYFVLIALMAGVIAWEILASGRQHVALVLFQIVLLGMNIAWSQLLIHPSLVGVDPWYHSALTNRIMDEGFIPGGYSYSKLPLFHLMVASTSLLTSLPYKFATMLSVSVGQIAGNAIFIFLIANNLFKNHRIGLLAALMVIIANHHIFMSYWSIPNGFGVAFIPIIVYLLLPGIGVKTHNNNNNNNNNNNLFSICIIIITLMISIILTHSMAAMFMAILLLVAWGASFFYRILYPSSRKFVTLLAPLGFSTAMVVWLVYVTGELGRLKAYIRGEFNSAPYVGTPDGFDNPIIPDPTVITPMPVDPIMVVPMSEELFNNIGMFIFFAIAFIGIFYMISRKGNDSTFTIAWLGVAPLSIGFFSLIFGLPAIEHRWWYMAQIFLSIPLAVAINIIGSWKSKKSLDLNTFVVIFIAILTFLMVLSPAANIDCHTISEHSVVTYALDYSELYSSDFIHLHAATSAIMSDQFFYYSQRHYIPNLDNMGEELEGGAFVRNTGATILIRKAILDEPMKINSATVTLGYDPNDLLSGPYFHKIYTGNFNNIYLGIDA